MYKNLLFAVVFADVTGIGIIDILKEQGFKDFSEILVIFWLVYQRRVLTVPFVEIQGGVALFVE